MDSCAWANSLLPLIKSGAPTGASCDEFDLASGGLVSALNHTSVDVNQQINRGWISGGFDLNLAHDKQAYDNNRDNTVINSTNNLLGLRYTGLLGPLGEVEFGYGNHSYSEIQGLNNLAGMISRNLGSQF